MSLSSALATRQSPGETQADPLGPHCRPRRGKWGAAHRAGGGGSSGGGLGPLCVTEAELSSVLPRAAPSYPSSYPSPVPARLKGSPHADTASRSGVPAGLCSESVRPTSHPPPQPSSWRPARLCPATMCHTVRQWPWPQRGLPCLQLSEPAGERALGPRHQPALLKLKLPVPQTVSALLLNPLRAPSFLSFF